MKPVPIEITLLLKRLLSIHLSVERNTSKTPSIELNDAHQSNVVHQLAPQIFQSTKKETQMKESETSLMN